MCCTSKRTSVGFFTRVPVQISKPFMQSWIIVSNHFQIALEKREIRHVEPSECGIQSYIRFRDMISEQIGRLSGGKMRLQTVKRLEQSMHIGVVCLLGGRKATLVDSIVNGTVHPFVHGLDIFCFVARKERFRGLAHGWIDEGIESSVEHADNLRGLIVNDGLALAVP